MTPKGEVWSISLRVIKCVKRHSISSLTFVRWDPNPSSWLNSWSDDEFLHEWKEWWISPLYSCRLLMQVLNTTSWAPSPGRPERHTLPSQMTKPHWWRNGTRWEAIYIHIYKWPQHHGLRKNFPSNYASTELRNSVFLNTELWMYWNVMFQPQKIKLNCIGTVFILEKSNEPSWRPRKNGKMNASSESGVLRKLDEILSLWNAYQLDIT